MLELLDGWRNRFSPIAGINGACLASNLLAENRISANVIAV